MEEEEEDVPAVTRGPRRFFEDRQEFTSLRHILGLYSRINLQVVTLYRVTGGRVPWLG